MFNKNRFFKDRKNLPHYYFIDKDLKGTVVNREFTVVNRECTVVNRECTVVNR